jgi:hypothetical protein
MLNSIDLVVAHDEFNDATVLLNSLHYELQVVLQLVV